MKTKMNQIISIVLFTMLVAVTGVSANENSLKHAPNNEIAIDSQLMVENWMLDQNNWSLSEKNVLNTTTSDENLSIENWMRDDKIWTNNGFEIAVENESVVEIIEWMTNLSIWNNSKPQLSIESEEKSEIENWMINDNNWNR